MGEAGTAVPAAAADGGLAVDGVGAGVDASVVESFANSASR